MADDGNARTDDSKKLVSVIDEQKVLENRRRYRDRESDYYNYAESEIILNLQKEKHLLGVSLFGINRLNEGICEWKPFSFFW